MKININELRNIKTLSIKVGNDYAVTLTTSEDGQTLDVITAQTNICYDKCCCSNEVQTNKKTLSDTLREIKTIYDNSNKKITDKKNGISESVINKCNLDKDSFMTIIEIAKDLNPYLKTQTENGK